MKLVWLILFAILVSCASVSPTHLPTHDAYVSESLTFHADQDFTEQQRQLIGVAISELATQTNRRFIVRITYDLDLHVEHILLPPGEWALMEVSESSAITDQLDALEGGTVLGICLRHTRGIFIEDERIETDVEFVHVIMHEFLHAFGLNHTNDRKAVMYPSATGDSCPINLNESDWALIYSNTGH